MKTEIMNKINHLDALRSKLKGSVASTSNYNDFIVYQINTIHGLNHFDLQKCMNFEEANQKYQFMNRGLEFSAYDVCYGNPEYATSIFGSEMGSIVANVYMEVSKLYKSHCLGNTALCHEIIDMITDMSKFILDDTFSLVAWQKCYATHKYRIIEQEMVFDYNCKFNTDTEKYRIICEKVREDFNNIKLYGENIGMNEVRMSEEMNALSDEKIRALADNIAKSYIRGFEVDGKNILLRNIVQIYGVIGQERLVLQLIKSLKEKGLNAIVSGMIGTPSNRQFDYDHKFNEGLVYSKDYVDYKLEVLSNLYVDNKVFTDVISGDIALEKFGETPFTPVSKSENIAFTEEQSRLDMNFENKKRALVDDFIPEEESSFCFIAFPTAEIGEPYAEIFNEIVEINMLQSEAYEEVQQVMIDALDKGKKVYVEGKGSNKTSIEIALCKLDDPAKETNFMNCGADVNIPVGEVFTTPVLEGTTGLLHIEQVYLEDFKYIDLMLEFTDGYITEYSCKNFDSETANKKFLEENLLFPHKTLPLSEFAIGTNTVAYMTALKYNILDKLPILIVEKMGPHMAIGDTCYSWREDMTVMNLLSGKEIISKDNAHSIIRNKSMDLAYTNKHIDITIPFDSIGVIEVVYEDSSTISIIENGRFVLTDTEFLNKPFKEKGEKNE